jgi:hypothetical protein
MSTISWLIWLTLLTGAVFAAWFVMKPVPTVF